MKHKVMTVIDENPHYWDLILAFLASIDNNSPNTEVSVYLFNRPAVDGYNLSKFNCVSAAGTESHDGSAFQKNYMRHLFMANELGVESVAWIDPDCIIRKPIDDLFCGVSGTSVKYWHKTGRKDRHKFQGGVYVLGSSKNTIRYCNSIFSQLEGTDDWMLPQLLMLKNIKRFNLEPVMLPESFNDSKFKKDSFIWHCKHSHFADAEFQKEYREYLEIGRRIISE